MWVLAQKPVTLNKSYSLFTVESGLSEELTLIGLDLAVD